MGQVCAVQQLMVRQVPSHLRISEYQDSQEHRAGKVASRVSGHHAGQCGNTAMNPPPSVRAPLPSDGRQQDCSAVRWHNRAQAILAHAGPDTAQLWSDLGDREPLLSQTPGACLGQRGRSITCDFPRRIRSPSNRSTSVPAACLLVPETWRGRQGGWPFHL